MRPREDPHRRRPRSRFLLGTVVGISCAIVGGSVAVLANGGSAAQAPSSNQQWPTVAALPAMSVFASPANASDALPASLEEHVARFAGKDGVPAAQDPGSLSTADSRKLLVDAGNDKADLYAFPTAKGRVCMIFTSGPVGGCFATFGGLSPVPFLLSGSPVEVFGLVPDNVTDVDVVVNGVAHAAQVQTNAFFYQLADSADFPEALSVTYRDGASARVEIPRPQS